MIQFTIRDKRLIIDVPTLSVPIFNEIWELDKSPKKENAFKNLLFIYHFKDYLSPYADVKYFEKELIIKKAVFGDEAHVFSEEEHKLINEGIKTYELLNKTSSKRALEILDKKMDQINTYLDDNTFDEINADQQFKYMKEYHALIASKNKVTADALKQQEDAKTKGDTKLGLLAKGLV